MINDKLKIKYRDITTGTFPDVVYDQTIPIDPGALMVEKFNKNSVRMFIDTGELGSKVSPETRNLLNSIDIQVVDELPSDASNHPDTIYLIPEKENA